MKKIMSFLVIPLLLIFIVFASLINADSLEYNPYQGNSLSGEEFSINSYVETLDKQLLDYSISIPSSFVKKAEDDDLELYVEESTLAIAVRVKENGYVYSSYDFNDVTLETKSEAVKNPIKSGISIDAYYSTGTPVTKSFLDKKTNSDGSTTRYAQAQILNITNGVKMLVDFSETEFQIRFEVNVTIENGQLVVFIPVTSIEEYNPNLFSYDYRDQYYLLKEIQVFPYFGSTRGEDDGYAVIPDGSGMIVNFDSVPESKGVFDLALYGDDLGYMNPTISFRVQSVNNIARLTMPIFGVVHDVGNTGFVAIAEQGSTYAIMNYSSATVVNSYHRMFFSYRYRDSYRQSQSRANADQYRISFQENVNDIDVLQRYIFLTGSDASYVGVAKAYRDYLINLNEFTDSVSKTYAQTPIKIDFIGTEITTGILVDQIVGITQYKEMKSIIQALQNDGYTELVTALKTYNKSDYGYDINLASSMGTKREFEDYLSYLSDNDIEFSYYLDYTRNYDDYSTKHAQTLSKNDIYQLEYSAMNIIHYVNDTSFYLGYAEDDLKILQKYGITNVAIAGLDRAIYTSYDKTIRSSYENIIDINQMLEFYETNGISANIYLPDAYAYKYLNEYYNSPLSSSEYTVQSAAIPLIELVLSGSVDFYSDYLNFISDESFSLLRLVEFGVYPSFILTGGSTYNLKDTNSSNVYISQYDVLKDRISTYYQFVSTGLNATMGQEMINHQYVSNGVVLVTYSNGTQIILNYNKSVYDYLGILVPAQGYEVIS